MPLQVPRSQAHKRNLLYQHGRELESQHGGVEHHAPGNFEQYRVPVPHHDGMPDAPRQPQFIHHADDDGKVPEKGDQHGSPHHWAIALKAEQVYGRCDCESARRQSHAAQRTQADPKTPGLRIGQVRGAGKTVEKSRVCCINPGSKDPCHDRPPQCNFWESDVSHGKTPFRSDRDLSARFARPPCSFVHLRVVYFRI